MTDGSRRRPTKSRTRPICDGPALLCEGAHLGRHQPCVLLFGSAAARSETGAAIITLLITLLIQTTWNREGAALQAKLDGVIRALEEAETRFTGLEQRDDEDIAQFCAEHNELVAGEAECLSTGQGGACAAAV